MTENMYHFIEDLRRIDVPALGVFLDRAGGLYADNMSSYTKMLIRRSFGRLMVCLKLDLPGILLIDRTSLTVLRDNYKPLLRAKSLSIPPSLGRH